MTEKPMNTPRYERKPDGTLIVSGIAFAPGGPQWRERQARLDAIKQAHLDRLAAKAIEPSRKPAASN